MMDSDTARRLYAMGIKEELDHMKHTWDEIKDNPDSPLKEAAWNYYAELMAENDRLRKIAEKKALDAVREVWCERLALDREEEK